MPVVLRHNGALELNLVEYSGAISLAELRAFAEHQALDPAYLPFDCLNVVRDGAIFASVDMADLDALFEYYRTLFAPLKLQIFRRAAWICCNGAGRAHIDYWIGGRDLREGMSSAVRRFDTLTGAGDWLMLSEAELSVAERAEGFDEILRLEIPVERPRAAAR